MIADKHIQFIFPEGMQLTNDINKEKKLTENIHYHCELQNSIRKQTIGIFMKW